MELRRGAVAVALAGAVCLGLGACGERSSEGSAGSAGSAHATGTDRLEEAVAALGPAYRYDLTSTCGERSLLGRYRVWVSHGQVEDAQPLGGTRLGGLRVHDFPTLLDLVAKVRDAPPGADVRVTTDGVGLPETLSLDPIPAAIDDEECYGVARVRNAQDEKSR